MNIIRIIALLFFSVYIFADEFYYELFSEVPSVSTSTLTERDSLKTASVMTIISEEEIRNSSALNLAALLNRLPGFNVYFKANSPVPSISFRGVTNSQNNDKFKLLINGQKVHEPLWGEVLFGYNLSTAMIKQVEVIRGAGSALYGSGAFIGLINVITKSPENDAGIQTSLRAGNNQTFSADIFTGGFQDELSYDFNFSYLTTDGPDGVIESDKLMGTPITKAPAKLRQKQEYIKLNGNIGNFSSDLNFFFSHADIFRPIPLLGYFTDDGQSVTNNTGFMNFNHNIYSGNDFDFKLTVSYSWSEIDDQGEYFPENFALPFDSDGNGVNEYWPDGAYAGYGAFSNELSSEIRWIYRGVDNHNLLGGIFYNSVSLDDVWVKMEAHPIYLSVVPRNSNFSESLPWISEENRDILGLYLQDEFRIDENIDLVICGRYDHYSDFGSTFNPRISLIWEFDDDNLGVVKAVYGSAFKAPTLAQLYQSNNPVTEGNVNLSEEEVDSLELQLTYVFAKSLKLNLTLFRMETENLIDATEEHRDHSKFYYPKIYWNENDTLLNGVECNLKYVMNDIVSFYANYSYTDAVDSETDEPLPLTAEVQAILGLTLSWNLISLNILADYTGKMEREPTDPRKDLSATIEVDTHISARLSDNLNISIGINNLTDEEVYAPTLLVNYPLSDIPQDSRSYYIEVSNKF